MRKMLSMVIVIMIFALESRSQVKATVITYVLRVKDSNSDTFRIKEESYTRYPVFIYKDKIVIKGKEKLVYNILTGPKCAVNSNGDSTATYNAVDNKFQKCEIAYVSHDPDYIYVDYGDLEKYYFLGDDSQSQLHVMKK